MRLRKLQFLQPGRRAVTHALLVEFRPPVAKETPRGAVAIEEVEIELVHKHALFGALELLHKIAAMIGDETRSIEFLTTRFRAHAIARDDRDHVRHRMSLHRALPGIACVE